MYPIIYEYNGLVISSYGFMLMIAFITCNYLLKKYLRTINIDPVIGDDIIFYAAIGGIVGAKIYYICEYLPVNADGISPGLDNLYGLKLILQGIVSFTFSDITKGISQFGTGLVFHGGLIGGLISVTLYIKKNNLNWLKVSDWVAPYLALGHSIGRIGCFLVGDCYGKPSELPWAISFPNGIPPTMITVHPTQLYETFIYFMIFLVLYKNRKRAKVKGVIMIQYLFLAGIGRFIIEFYRVNPKYFLNLSSAQLISIFMIIFSFIIYYYSLDKTKDHYKALDEQ